MTTHIPISRQAKLMRGTVRRTLKPFLRRGVSLAFQRQFAGLASRMAPLPQDVEETAVMIGGVPALRFRLASANSAPKAAVMYAHGGAFILGGPSGYRGLCGGLAKASGADVIALDYRLAPEHFYPSAPDDALAAYTALTQEYDAVAVAGDSAGGNLALVTAIAARDQQLSAAAAALLISPWLDLTCSGESFEAEAAHDPLLNPDWVRWGAELYSAKHRLDNPRLSPLFADHAGLPPTLVLGGERDVLFSDSVRFVESASSVGVDVSLHSHPDLWHVYPIHGQLLPESRTAIELMGQFLAKRMMIR